MLWPLPPALTAALSGPEDGAPGAGPGRQPGPLPGGGLGRGPHGRRLQPGRGRHVQPRRDLRAARGDRPRRGLHGQEPTHQQMFGQSETARWHREPRLAKLSQALRDPRRLARPALAFGLVLRFGSTGAPDAVELFDLPPPRHASCSGGAVMIASRTARLARRSNSPDERTRSMLLRGPSDRAMSRCAARGMRAPRARADTWPASPALPSWAEAIAQRQRR